MWFTSPSTPIQGVGVDKDCTSQFVMTNTIKYCTTLHYTAQSLQFVDSHDLVANKPQQSCQDAQVLHLWPRVWMFGFTRGARFCTQMDGVLWVFTVVQQSDKMWQDVTRCDKCINLFWLHRLHQLSGSVGSVEAIFEAIGLHLLDNAMNACLGFDVFDKGQNPVTILDILVTFGHYFHPFSSLFSISIYFSLFLSISLSFWQMNSFLLLSFRHIESEDWYWRTSFGQCSR